jgi:kanamycin kinase
MLAGGPEKSIEIPRAVKSLAAGRSLRAVWENELGGVTFEVTGGSDRRFIKWAPAGSGLDLKAEVARLEWVAAFTAVPRVLEFGEDQTGAWHVTAALSGETAVSERWKAEPAMAAAAVGVGLRAFHDAVPPDHCPFSWSAPDRLVKSRQLAAIGGLDPARWHPEHQHLSIDRALGQLAEIPPVDKVVVCHGDACLPNSLLSAEGRCTGHVDLGAMGVGDRWADLAVASWSTVWNYGPGWEELLLAAYGVAPQPELSRYYRLLWDLSS